MRSRKIFLAAALCLPLLALGALTARNQFLYATGKDVTLPIKGYDPRDLLAGHYLQYEIDYGIENLCQKKNKGKVIKYQGPAIACLQPRLFIEGEEPPKTCSLFIRGICTYNRFEAGVERYYIPEHLGSELEKKVLDRKASIILSITGQGNAMVRDLLLDGQSWRGP